MDQQAEALVEMGWYLDTSLFRDFIAKNVRVGFDNVEMDDGHTILHITGTGNKDRRIFVPVIANGKRFAFELTSNVNCLRNIQISNKIQYYYSELTKAEVLRSLRREHPDRASSEILEWWVSFCFIIGDYQKVDLDFKIDDQLSNLALGFPIRKNVQDYIHLIIAKEKGLAYVTSDKLDDQIEDLRRSYYPHIYLWPEIKDQVPVDDVLRQLRI